MLLTVLLAVGCATDDDWEADGNAVGPESFSWTRGAVEETRIAFLRNLGVGYGYNAVSGRYCNYADIRCQILNRRQLEKAAQASGMTLWHTDYTSRSYSTSQVAYNEHDYVATFNLGRESSFNYIIYKEEQTYRQNILEDGLRQSFYFSTDDYEQVATQWLDVGNTIDAMSAGLDPYQILTRSFADAVEHLGESTEPAAVDSFLQVYGTHVVVRTAIGGRLHIDLKNDMKRYGRKMQEEECKNSHDVNYYASRLYVSPRYLSQVTRRVASQSPKSIIDSSLLGKIKELLKTDKTIQEIAYQLEFSSQAHLSNFFKRFTGTSPSDYRKLIVNG